jgi:hypothetical protein
MRLTKTDRNPCVGAADWLIVNRNTTFDTWDHGPYYGAIFPEDMNTKQGVKPQPGPEKFIQYQEAKPTFAWKPAPGVKPRGLIVRTGKAFKVGPQGTTITMYSAFPNHPPVEKSNEELLNVWVCV